MQSFATIGAHMGDLIATSAPGGGAPPPPSEAWVVALEKILPPVKRFTQSQAHLKRAVRSFRIELHTPHYRFSVHDAFFEEQREYVEAALRALVSKIEETQAEGFAYARAEGHPHQMERETLIQFCRASSLEDPADWRDRFGAVVAEYRDGQLSLLDD